MVEIVVNGEVIATQPIPNYVYRDEKIDSWRGTEEWDKAEALLVYIQDEEQSKDLYLDIDEKPYRHFDDEGNPFLVCTIRVVNE